MSKLAIAYATKRRANAKSSKRAETMIGDKEQFLSAEDGSNSPFQDQETDSDSAMLSEKLGEDYDALSDLDNTIGNADQDAARSSVLERIMRKVRSRNMGR